MTILENLKEVLPSWAVVTQKELPYKMEYEIRLQPILDEVEHFALTPKIKEACQGKFMERYTVDIGEHFYIYTKK